MRFSNSGSTASGVTSRPVKPVPPVEMMTSIALSAIQVRICSRIFSTSSVTMARPATAWPAFSIRSASVAPDLSSAELAGVGHRQHRDLERHEGALVVDAGHGGAIIAVAAAKVLQALTVPSLKPVENQRLRCSALPWVKLSGTTVPCVCRCSVSSPIADAVCNAASMSPGSRNLLLRLGVVGPDAGEAVGLQFDLHLQSVGLRRGCRTRAAPAAPWAGCRAGSARDGRPRARSHRPCEKSQALPVQPRKRVSRSRKNDSVEIDLAIVRAIERPHRALRRAAGRTRLAREHDEPGRAIGLAFLGEDVLPLHLGAAEDARDESSGLVGRRAGAPRGILLLGAAGLLVTAAGRR